MNKEFLLNVRINDGKQYHSMNGTFCVKGAYLQAQGHEVPVTYPGFLYDQHKEWRKFHKIYADFVLEDENYRALNKLEDQLLVDKITSQEEKEKLLKICGVI